MKKRQGTAVRPLVSQLAIGGEKSSVLGIGRVLTIDVGGKATTEEMGDAIAAAIA